MYLNRKRNMKFRKRSAKIKSNVYRKCELGYLKVRFLLDKNYYNLVDSLQLIKITFTDSNFIQKVYMFTKLPHSPVSQGFCRIPYSFNMKTDVGKKFQCHISHKLKTKRHFVCICLSQK